MTMIGAIGAVLGGLGTFYAAFCMILSCDHRRPGAAAFFAMIVLGVYGLILLRLFG